MSLWHIYRSLKTPRDQLDRKGPVLRRITDVFHLITGLEWTAEQVYRAIMTRCKNPSYYGWGNHNGDYHALRGLPTSFVPLEHLPTVCRIYLDIGTGADEFKFNASLRRRFAQLLKVQSGHSIEVELVGAYLVDLRKDYLLPCLHDKRVRRRAFSDFDQLPNAGSDDSRNAH